MVHNVCYKFYLEINVGKEPKESMNNIELCYFINLLKSSVYTNHIPSLQNVSRLTSQNLHPKPQYRIFPAIRRGFRPSRMTSNDLISPMKFCYKTNSTLPKRCQSSRSVLQDGSRTFGLFWKEKTPSYNRRNTVIVFVRLSEPIP